MNADGNETNEQANSSGLDQTMESDVFPQQTMTSSDDGYTAFCESEFGQRCAAWLREDLRENGPIHLSVFGQGHFLPSNISVSGWLDHLDFVQSETAKPYCELRELSPDRRTVRTKAGSVLPQWMIKAGNIKSAAVTQQQEYGNSQRGFFVGVLKVRKSEIGFKRNYYVSDVILEPDIENDDIPMQRVASGAFLENEFVVGWMSSKGSFLFFNQQVNSAVQIILWSSVKESEGGVSAEAYFRGQGDGVLHVKFPYLLGNSDKPGSVLIQDEESYYKGFLSIGDGVLQFSNVARSAEDFQSVLSKNQITEFKYKDSKFAIAVPEKNNSYAVLNKHAVLDRDGWVRLVGGVPPSPSLRPSREKIRARVLNVLGDHEWHDRSNVIETLRGTEDGLDWNAVPDQELIEVLKSIEELKFWQDTSGAWTVNIPSVKGVARYQCSEEEERFLKSFIEDVGKCGYSYTTQDLIRFHTSVKVGAFTLLGGVPGSGKSTLVALYARALLGTCSPDAKSGLLTVAVNPAWMEPNDVLGYWNLKGRYCCASTGLVPFLRTALNSNQIAIVCLEEMNLARVEHYFSDFLQVLSRPPEERKLFGVPADDSIEERDAEIVISKGLRFVGTNNFDETTQRFSARFYDRCNYIELTQDPKIDVFPAEPPSFKRGDFNRPVNLDEYEKWVAKDFSSTKLEGKVVERFKTILALLKDLNLSPSPRVRLAILEYIANRPFFEGCGAAPLTPDACQLTALDEAIAQRVLPRYRVDYLRDESESRKKLLEGLEKDMPVSYSLFCSKCDVGERPSR